MKESYTLHVAGLTRELPICDLNEKTVARWTAEMGQIAWPWDFSALPEVEPVGADHLFDCDVFIFAATKSIPAVGSAVKDVRMAQLEANKKDPKKMKKTGFAARLEAMQKQQEELMKQRQGKQ